VRILFGDGHSIGQGLACPISEVHARGRHGVDINKDSSVAMSFRGDVRQYTDFLQSGVVVFWCGGDV
jgi:hypothetical protein